MASYNLLLIDSRISDIETILQSLNAETIGLVFQYDSDTYGSITDAIKSKLLQLQDAASTPTIEPDSETTPQTQTPQSTVSARVQAVGILQHNYKTPVYQFVASEPESTLEDVVAADPQLETWTPFSDFVAGLVSQYGVTALDLMACALYSDANWKYVIDTLSTGLGITIRASIDNTGDVESGGNWVLETSGVNLTTVYFTEEIYKWKYVLAIFPDYFVVRTGPSGWRPLIAYYPSADITTDIQTWGPDAQFHEYLGGINQIAEQFSYFAGYWLNRNRIQDNTTYSVRVYFKTDVAKDQGRFDFYATSNNPVDTYSGRFTGYNNTIRVLSPQQDGITAGIAAGYTTPTLSWASSYSPPSVANIATGPYFIAATSASSGAVSYNSSNQNVATISAANITLVGVGTTTITASQAADPVRFYNAPADISVTLTVIRTPVFTGSASTLTKYYSDIGSTFSVTAPANSAFTPNLVSPTFTYSIEYLTNSEYANANLKTAEFVTPSSATCTVRGTGQCYLKVTSNQNLANFLDVATANFILLTVRPGYIVGPNVNLTGAIIQNYDLSGTILSGVVFTNASIINCILDNVNMSSAIFAGATFAYNRINAGTNLTGADFQNLTSNNISGTTALISSTWTVQSGRIVASGTILFALTFTMASASTISLGEQRGITR